MGKPRKFTSQPFSSGAVAKKSTAALLQYGKAYVLWGHFVRDSDFVKHMERSGKIERMHYAEDDPNFVTFVPTSHSNVEELMAVAEAYFAQHFTIDAK